MTHFEKGLQYYFAKEFTKTKVSFDLVIEKNPQDRTAILFFKRATDYLSIPVSADWNGIEKIDKK